jgi:hypothetical protein
VLKSDGQGGSWLQRFALADDHEDANGSTILDFWQACDMARQLARGDNTNDVDGGRPPSVGAAMAAYERDLISRGAAPKNAQLLRCHLKPAMLDKPVGLLRAAEIRSLRDDLIAKGLKRSTVNRYQKCLSAWLTLAARAAERIGNARVWKLPALGEADAPRNLILTDAQVAAVVKAACAISDRFGIYIEFLAILGVRPIQTQRLSIADLECEYPDARINMPSSAKGSGRKRIERPPLRIPPGLATRLKGLAAGRPPSDPLMIDDHGQLWTSAAQFGPALDMAPLERALAKLRGPIGVIVLDPVIMMVRGDSHKNAETPVGLQPFHALFAAIGASALGVHHLTKRSEGADPIDRVSGSLAVGALPRVVLLSARDMNDEIGQRRGLVRGKVNNGPDWGGFEYRRKGASLRARPASTLNASYGARRSAAQRATFSPNSKARRRRARARTGSIRSAWRKPSCARRSPAGRALPPKSSARASR